MDPSLVFNFILAALTLLFGGGMIFQWLTIKSLKRQKEAEATKSEVDALRAIIEANTSEIARLNQRVELADKRAIEADNRYNKLYAEYYSLKSEFEKYKISNVK